MKFIFNPYRVEQAIVKYEFVNDDFETFSFYNTTYLATCVSVILDKHEFQV